MSLSTLPAALTEMSYCEKPALTGTLVLFVVSKLKLSRP